MLGQADEGDVLLPIETDEVVQVQAERAVGGRGAQEG